METAHAAAANVMAHEPRAPRDALLPGGGAAGASLRPGSAPQIDSSAELTSKRRLSRRNIFAGDEICGTASGQRATERSRGGYGLDSGHSSHLHATHAVDKDVVFVDEVEALHLGGSREQESLE